MSDGGPKALDPEGQELSLTELVQLCAVDSDLFSRMFFPKAFRQPPAPFHKRMWGLLESPQVRFGQLICHRDSAKTTLLRSYTAKRIAYGISKTVLYVGASEAHAIRSIQWLRAQVEKNQAFSTTFGLKPGQKWQENEASIYRATEDEAAWILGVGITGNIRGINFDNYRPDLIILDDIVTDENAATREQREKVIDLVFGALKESLAPRSEEPNAKMVMLQTPINREDVSALIAQSAEWHTEWFPCWTKETWDLDVTEQESAWPERYPTAELRATKLAAIESNMLSKFLREKECRLVSPETAAFREEWIRELAAGEEPPRAGMTIVAIDPVPPPSDRELSKNLAGKDYEAILVLRRSGGEYFVLEYAVNRGHEPNWTIAKLFELAFKYRVARIAIEAVAYQRTLEYLIRQEMKKRGIYWPVIPVVDRRKKYQRIISTLAGPLSAGKLTLCGRMPELKEQLIQYPTSSHEDILDALAIAVQNLSQYHIDLEEGEWAEVDESHIPDLNPRAACP